MVAAALLAGDGKRRALRYALVLAAAAMKFYPLVALALRERMRVASRVFLFAAGLSVLFALAFRSELAEILPPRPNPLGDTFGANHLVRAFQDWASPLGGLAALGAQLAAVFLAIRTFARRPEIGEAFDSLPALAQIQLLTNAAIVIGGYFLLENIGYRAVILLPPLFCCIRLAESAAKLGARRVFGAVSAAMLVCLWMLSLQQIVALLFGGGYDPVSGSVAGYAFWTIRELLWSFVAGALGGLLVRFAARSQSAIDLEAWLRRFSGRLAASNVP